LKREFSQNNIVVFSSCFTERTLRYRYKDHPLKATWRNICCYLSRITRNA